jgi:hypothetical protein
MKHLNLILVHAEQGNPHYDPDTANNGGGYDQPQLVYEDEENSIEVVVDDSSCGDFGERYNITILRNGKCIFCAVRDEMDSWREYVSKITDDIRQLVEEVEMQIGYNITSIC